MLVNGEEIQFASGSFLNELITHLQLNDKKGLAVAVNNTVIPKLKWAEYVLNENDKITIIRATQGG